MNKSKDIIMISDTDSEYIDKIILILNNKKKIVKEDQLIKQAEKIIFEYENKNHKKSDSNIFKIILILSACVILSIITCFVSMQLFS